MRLRELTEENNLHLRDFVVTVSPHSLDRAREKGVNPHAVDKILRNISSIKSKIMGIEPGARFIIHDGQGTGLGMRRHAGPRLTLATVYDTSPDLVQGLHPTFKVVIPKSIKEAESSTPNARAIHKELVAAGYHWLGTGADARVWAKDSTYVIKILMPDDPASRAEEIFRKFYEFAEAHSELSCLPVFNEVNDIAIKGKRYTQIDMERLVPLTKNSVHEAMVWILSDYATKSMSWKQVAPKLLDIKTWELFSGIKAATIVRRIDAAIKLNAAAFNEKYGTLFTVMQLLYKTGQINKFGWDLHTENVMQRKNGELVIIDPWFAMNEMSA